MTSFDKEAYDRKIKWGLLIASVVSIALLVAAALVENLYPEWRGIRSEYQDILIAKATDDQGTDLAQAFEIGIDQLYVPALGKTDRCVTCHTGLQDPRMADQTNPYKAHPGDFLSNHPPDRFGCTICHQGQGLATESDAAHGRVPHWPTPIIEPEYLYSACTACHDSGSLYGDQSIFARDVDGTVPAGAALMLSGRDLVKNKGCLGCHQLDGQGGKLGPDITFVGDKTAHDFDFTHFGHDEPRTVSHWLKRHFLDPSEVSPNTVMPAAALTENEADALTAYALSLKHRNIVPGYTAKRTTEYATAAPSSGEALYAEMCSACHGLDGKTPILPHIRTPSLNNVDTLATCSDDYLRYIIERGRTNTAMPAWGADGGNLSHQEIDSLVGYIRAWEPEGASPENVSARVGDAAMGASYFRGMCLNCHGEGGVGGIGNTLNSDTFLSIASDEFLAETIINGRPGTAMASWKHLPAQAISDLLAYIRSWEAEPASYSDVRRAAGIAMFQGDLRTGKILYQANCASCHGNDGEGTIGPRLNSPNILPVVDNEFLHHTIVKGRPGTAMPSWKHLSADAIGSIVTYLRSWNGGAKTLTEEPPGRGDFALGEVHYKISCAACHGTSGEGGVGPQLTNPEFLNAVSDEVLYHWIARGRTGTAMKGFLEEEQGPTQLTPAHIADVIAFLRHTGAQGKPPVHRSGVGNPHLGRQLYEGTCASCHGLHGEGASGPQLNNSHFLAAASDGFLAATIVLGRNGTPMQSMVHGQSGIGQIDPALVQDVIAYIRMWDVEQRRRKPRAVAEMSRRAIQSGGENFAKFCSACHGPNGMGELDGVEHFAPALNNPEFLQAASDGFLLATIARGRSNTPMRPFGTGAGGIAELTTEDINDIVSFIRTWQEADTP